MRLDLAAALAATLLLALVAGPSAASAPSPCETPSLPLRCATWREHYDGSGKTDSLLDVAAAPDGRRVYAAGVTVDGSNRPRALVLALDAETGERLWERTMADPSTSVSATALAVAPDGTRVYVMGSGYGPDVSLDYRVWAFDAGGQQRWAAAYDHTTEGFDQDDARAIAVSPDGGRVVVTGASYSKGTKYDVATVAWDAGTGEREWVARHAGPFDGDDIGTAVAIGADGSVHVAGGEGASGQALTVLSHDGETGAVRWSSRLHTGTGTANELAVTPDGATLVVGGAVRTATAGYEFAVAALDAAGGATRWSYVHPSPVPGDDVAYGVAVSPDGRTAAATGYTGAADWEALTVAFDLASGATLWTAVQPGPGTDAGLEIGIASSGATFITGYASYPARPMVTAYAADGTLRWRDVPAGTGIPTGLAVTSSGVFASYRAGTSELGWDGAVARYLP